MSGGRPVGTDLEQLERAVAALTDTDRFEDLEARLLAIHGALLDELALRTRSGSRARSTATAEPGASGALGASGASGLDAAVDAVHAAVDKDPGGERRADDHAGGTGSALDGAATDQTAPAAPLPAPHTGEEPLEPLVRRLVTTPPPASSEPVVSIIIPMFNHTRDTLLCLTSLAAAPPAVPIEVVVVDDCSTEPDVRLLDRIPGVVVARTPTNSGFVGACNHGAGVARGSMLLFLNNDTEVRDGAIDALVGSMLADPRVGVVGPKLLFPDGTVQEAGGLVFEDASAWNYGRGEAADLPRLNYARDVDFVSGAALLVDRALFEDAGGFDQRYAPAYYEDTDLCFAAAARGRRVVFQPAAEVIHFEGVSYGTGHGDDKKSRQMRINEKRFAEKWHDRLSAHGPRAVDLERQKERDVDLRVLVVDARMVTPDHDAGSVRMAHILFLLRDLGHKVTFVPANRIPLAPYTADLCRRGIEVIASPHLTTLEEHLAAKGDAYDVVVLSRLEVAADHLPDVRRFCPNAEVVFDTVDLHFLREARQARGSDEVSGPAVTGGPSLTREVELEMMRRSDLTLVCSTLERDFIDFLDLGIDVEVLSLVHDEPRSTAPPEARDGLLFVGGFEHPPNADGVLWFAHHILPLVVAAHPVRLDVVGSKVPTSIEALAGPHIDVLGFVDDLGPRYESSRVTVAPLRFGAGVKGKVVQSMMRGVPVVGTSIAFEGMPIVPEVHALVADDPDTFANQVLRLLTDDDLWRRIAAAGRQLSVDHYSLDATRSGVERMVSRGRVPGQSSSGQSSSSRSASGRSEPRRPGPR